MGPGNYGKGQSMGRAVKSLGVRTQGMMGCEVKGPRSDEKGQIRLQTVPGNAVKELETDGRGSESRQGVMGRVVKGPVSDS